MKLRSQLLSSTLLVLGLLGGGTFMAVASPLGDSNTSETVSQRDSSEIDANALIDHLNAIDARMYGVFWCPHCTHQKEVFGEAASRLEEEIYVECDPRGENPQTQLCIDKNIRGVPTWEIHGKMYSGVRSLATLAQLSEFRQ